MSHDQVEEHNPYLLLVQQIAGVKNIDKQIVLSVKRMIGPISKNI